MCDTPMLTRYLGMKAPHYLGRSVPGRRYLHRTNSLLPVVSVAAQNLPQLYRFCLLMTGEASKAQDIFQDTLREAAFLAANGEPPADRYWFFREARWRCLDVVAHDVQPEQAANESTEVSPQAPEQIEQLEPEQLAIWISSAPEPQRSALALYYLDEFNYREMMSMLGLKLNELSRAIASGRREFQAWLNATVPVAAEE
jgi:DNA-directed RNA polymerase specialized sigma24 family protein